MTVCDYIQLKKLCTVQYQQNNFFKTTNLGPVARGDEEQSGLLQDASSVLHIELLVLHRVLAQANA